MPIPGQDSVRDLLPFQIFRTISTLRVVSHEKSDCGLPLSQTLLPRSRHFTFHNKYLPANVQPKSISKMKNQKFEIAVAGYDYRFKTYARDGMEASVKVKCFLRQPDAECTILPPTLKDYLRATESCRRQVARR